MNIGNLPRALLLVGSCVAASTVASAQQKPAPPPAQPPAATAAAPSPKGNASPATATVGAKTAPGDPKLGALDAATQRLLATQIALDRAGCSAGEIAGRRGSNTERALRAFQDARKLPVTGQLDAATIAALGEPFTNPLTTYTITAADTAGPFVASMPADMMKKSALPA